MPSPLPSRVFHLLFWLLLAPLGARAQQAPAWQWAASPGAGMGFATLIDPAGDVLVTGSFSGTIRFDTVSLAHSLGSAGFNDVYVAKYSARGELRWAVRAGGEQNETGCAVAADSAGNAYVAGLFTSPAVDFGSIRRANTRDPFLDPTHTADAFVAKLSGAGKWLWATQAQGDRDERPADLCADSAGTARLTGTFESPTLGLGGTTLRREAKRRGATAGANASRSAWFAAELSAAGAWQWAVGGPGGTGGLSVGRGGEVALTGFFPDSVVTLGPVTLNGPDEDGGLSGERLTRHFRRLTPISLPHGRPCRASLSYSLRR